MRSLRDSSINTKLNLLAAVAGGVALLLSCGAFAVNDYLMIRDSKIRQLQTMAEVLGSNSTAALEFDRPDEVAELLRSLQKQPTIQNACLYDRQGKVFARYHKEGLPHCMVAEPGPAGYKFAEDGSLDYTQHVFQDGELVGTIYLCASMTDLYAQLFSYVKIVAVVMVVSLAGSILLSSRLQRVISVPILRLAETVQKISTGGDYSIRVEKGADDELGSLYDEFNGMLDRIQRGEKELQRAHDELEIRVQQRTGQLSRANLELSREVAERKRAEEELEGLHRTLVETARQAGMAEIATGVLHNVGNVLNSINVSATLTVDRLRHLKLSDLSRAVGMLGQHTADLPDFLSRDHKGKLLPEFLAMLAEHLQQERQTMLEELATLTKNVDHVKTIVAMQQSYAGVAGMVETASLDELIEDALKLNSSSFEKYSIQLVRDYAELPQVRVEKQKLLQLLVNLITNAKDSLVESTAPDKRLTVRVMGPVEDLGPAEDLGPVEDTLRIEVADNGIGIPPEDLARVFSHGFTTKRRGHGFGLHSSANAAKEMGGRLSAESEGTGRGATFVVVLPYNPVEVPV